MTSEIEAILRRVEKDFTVPKYKRGVATIRAAVWAARRDGEFPEHVTMPEDRGFVYVHPDFEFHAEDGSVFIGGNRVNLTLSESRILDELSRRANYLVTREELVARMRGSADVSVDPDKKIVNVHMSHLRGKMKRYLGSVGDPIETLHGFGYRLLDPSRPAPSRTELVGLT